MFFLRSIFYLTILHLIVFIVTSCKKNSDLGVLHIKSPEKGAYEIYSIAGDSTLQFVSEKVGHFNEDLFLSPGSYLILADCSHRTLTVHPNSKYTLAAHVVHFIPPHTPDKGDLFSIQCSRYDKSHLRQQIKNRFSFHMVSGAKDLLIGMLPLRIEFPQASGLLEESQTQSFNLSALRVDSKNLKKETQSLYFVSPNHGLLSITQAQELGKWQFLLPGDYKVHINGTEQTLGLNEGESHSINSASIVIEADKKIDLSQLTQVRGSPFFVELNNGHPLDVNTNYPVLPGQVNLRFDNSSYFSNVNLVEDKLSKVSVRTVFVDSSCSPWEWECLGKKEVNLYLPNQQYPFMESISDIPILYPDMTVEIGLEGSKGIRQRLSSHNSSTYFKIGRLEITPVPTYKPPYISDLLRLEAHTSDVLGHSYDIVPEKTTTMTLIAGSYALAKYSMILPENERVTQKQIVYVRPGETTSIEVPYYASEAVSRVQGKGSLQKKRQKEGKIAAERKIKKPFVAF